jgi:hypothetical protein
MRGIRIAGSIFEINHFEEGLANPEIMSSWREPLAQRDWEGYIWRVPRPYRLHAFLEVEQSLTDPEYWRLLGEIWTDAEMPNVNRVVWLALFTSKRTNRDHVMDAGDHAAVDRLTDPVQVYRGAHLKYARGMSWTTDPDRAAWFATRFGYARGGKVFTTTAAKRKILGYFADRNEDEVLIDPRRIRLEAINWTEDQLNEAAGRAKKD